MQATSYASNSHEVLSIKRVWQNHGPRPEGLGQYQHFVESVTYCSNISCSTSFHLVSLEKLHTLLHSRKAHGAGNSGAARARPVSTPVRV